jgi:DNA-binding transcriptional MerR regulator
MTEYTVRYTLVQYEDEQTRYSAETVAEMAGVSLAELARYAGEGIVQPHRTSDGSPAYSLADLREVASAARLRREVDLDLETLEVIMHLRRQVVESHRQMEALRRSFMQRERDLLEIINQLRQQMAVEARWR